MKFAYFGIPHLGGTYTVYRQLKDGLLPHGIEVRWVGIGEKAGRISTDPAWVHEKRNGEAVSANTSNRKIQARLLNKHIIDSDYQGVFINVLANDVQTNIARYLPISVLRFMIVHSITPSTYRAASAVRDHIHCTIGVSPRIREDLIRHYQFPENRIHVIPNAVNLAPFENIERDQSCKEIKIISLGRIEDASKGVFWLADILKLLQGVLVKFTIAGDGPDLGELKRRCYGLSNVNFLGKVEPSFVPDLFSEHDIFLMPSRFEGFGYTVIEAMAAGCVPVVSKIRGVTDYIIENGITGFLFPVGDTRQASELIRKITSEKALLGRASAAAKEAVKSRFSNEKISAEYFALIQKIASSPPLIREPLDINNWKIPRGLKPHLLFHLPQPMKNILRKWRERLH